MEINYVAILVSAIATQFLGAFWYSPVGFGRPWMEMVGLKMEEIDKSEAKKGYLLAFISSLARAFAIAWLVLFTDAHGLNAGLRLGAWLGLGIVATTLIPNYFFAGRPRKLYLIDVGHSVIAILMTTTILTAWPQR